MNIGCVLGCFISLTFFYCSFCSNDSTYGIFTDDFFNNCEGCIILDRDEIVVGEDRTCDCYVDIYLKSDVTFEKLLIALYLNDHSPQGYVEINNQGVARLKRDDMSFDDVNYNGFSKHYRNKFTFRIVSTSVSEYVFKIWLCKNRYNEADVIARPLRVKIRKRNEDDIKKLGDVRISDVIENAEIIDNKNVSVVGNEREEFNSDNEDLKSNSNNSAFVENLNDNQVLEVNSSKPVLGSMVEKGVGIDNKNDNTLINDDSDDMNMDVNVNNRVDASLRVESGDIKFDNDNDMDLVCGGFKRKLPEVGNMVVGHKASIDVKSGNAMFCFRSGSSKNDDRRNESVEGLDISKVVDAISEEELNEEDGEFVKSTVCGARKTGDGAKKQKIVDNNQFGRSISGCCRGCRVR